MGLQKGEGKGAGGPVDDGGSDRISDTPRTQPALDARAVGAGVVGERTTGVAGWQSQSQRQQHQPMK